MTTLLWGALPYVACALLVTGLVWRYRYDKYGWTTRSSQVYEAKLLNVASPAFHYGILCVLAGHVVGLFTHASGDGYDYRQTIAPWARSLFTLRPRTDLMTGVPVLYQVHAVVGMVLIALVPCTRLVHMFSAPLQYLFRPYVVYRSRPPEQLDPRPNHRAWESPRH
ncbi:respiratory nitrate reductase subunit gamma [Streptomyces arenae]|uniref:respiratory nitrate reductase subunit gamma n=1 Tax=Streptomyces arenae TaxID=29301 RepID=UPI00265AF9DB|nr:respiratory nitrate reductase subunit gamma [Streptomyces arenae]MCG7202527.1 respiratory nitrate reductase subunit gamma [Streptomyces arenae]